MVSFCSMSLRKVDDSLDRTAQEDDIKSVAATLYGGTFILYSACCLYERSLSTAGADSVGCSIALKCGCILTLQFDSDI